jgi:hypothetical protein
MLEVVVFTCLPAERTFLKKNKKTAELQSFFDAFGDKRRQQQI